MFVTSISCNKEDTPTLSNRGGVFFMPKHFPSPQYIFNKNRLSQQGFDLGKKLFYDPILSIDNTISCSSCHLQNFAFSDPIHTFSIGVGGNEGLRNSPPLFNLAWNTSFMWDGGINHLEIMSIGPIENPLEMGETIRNVISKLNQDEVYRSKFSEVFDVDSITDKYFFWAITQFLGNMVSANSKYDNVLNGVAEFSELEHQGYQVFKVKCQTCHIEPLFTDFSFRNIGVETSDKENGRFDITLDSVDFKKFKVPSLRNIMLTSPYMHNGSIENIEQVLNHYANPQKFSKYADERVKQNSLEMKEIEPLLAFLNTLTDNQFITNPIYAKEND